MRKSNSEHLVVCVDSTCCGSKTIAINSERALFCVLGTGQSKYSTVLYYARLKNKNKRKGNIYIYNTKLLN